MYKKSFLILVSFYLVSLFWGCSPEKKEVKIGAILPLTGGSAIWGKNIQKGIDLAVEEINLGTGINGLKIKILYEDTQGEPSKGVSALQKLIATEDLRIFIDDANSSVSLALAPISDKNKIIQLITGASSPKIKYAGDYVFRIWNSDAMQANALADYAYQELNLLNIAILYINNDYGIGLKNEFSESFSKQGGEIIFEDGYDPNQKDFRTLINKINTLKPDAVFFVSYPDEGPSLMRQLRELNFKGIVLGNGDILEDQSILDAAGNAVNGIYYATNSAPDSSSKVVIQFRQSFYNKYKENPGITAPEGYDAVQIIKSVLDKTSNSDGEKLKEAFYKVQNYTGASGLISFDSFGEVHKPMVIKRIQNGRSIVLKY